MTSITTSPSDSAPRPSATDITSEPPRLLRTSSPVLRELDREWDRLCRRPSSLRRARGWTDVGALGAATRAARNLDDIVAASQPGAGHGDGSEVVRALLEVAATDDLAGRIVIQRILPGLIAGSRKWGLRGTTADDPVDVIIGAAWIAIRNFDVANRHVYIAPALVADALWIGFRRHSRRMQATEIPLPSDVLAFNAAAPVELHPIRALAATVRAAVCAGVDPADLDVLRDILAAGSPSKAALARGVTVRTIRNRRDAATAKIRVALGPDWGDWSDPLVAA